MDKPLSPRSDIASDDIISPKAQSIAEEDAAREEEESPSNDNTVEETQNTGMFCGCFGP